MRTQGCMHTKRQPVLFRCSFFVYLSMVGTQGWEFRNENSGMRTQERNSGCELNVGTQGWEFRVGTQGWEFRNENSRTQVGTQGSILAGRVRRATKEYHVFSHDEFDALRMSTMCSRMTNLTRYELVLWVSCRTNSTRYEFHALRKSTVRISQKPLRHFV